MSGQPPIPNLGIISNTLGLSIQRGYVHSRLSAAPNPCLGRIFAIQHRPMIAGRESSPEAVATQAGTSV